MIVHWDYSSIANFKTKIPSIFRWDIWNFFWVVFQKYPTEAPRDVLQNSGLRNSDLGYDGWFQCNFISSFPRRASDMIFICQCVFDGSEKSVKYPTRNVTSFRTVFLNNQLDAVISQIYSVIKIYMFRVPSLPIIRSFLLYFRHW